MSVLRFVRLLFNPPRHDSVPDESLESLLRTVDDAIHVRGGHGPSIPVAGNSKIYRMIARGHQNYTASFKSMRKRS
ncbi:MAG: hypothetical protein OXS29_05195 [bacterium]|nr:hypothetical protein [bacterium]MDE0289115.1 hypothetical protein [bacterium]MDE0440384.1 hypothetical protein [bacterium]